MRKVLVSMCFCSCVFGASISETLVELNNGSNEFIALDSTIIKQDPVSLEARDVMVPSFSPSQTEIIENLVDLNMESQEIAAFDSMIIQQNSISFETIDAQAPDLDLPRKSPFIAVGLSFLVPGLGHTYLGDMKTASGLLGSAGAGYGLALSPGISKSTQLMSLMVAQSAGMYGIYAAYRDVRIFNRQEGYFYNMPNDSLVDMALAPFKWSILKKPEVWGGFLGAMAVAAGATYFFLPKDLCIRPVLSSQSGAFPLLALPVGVSEEAFFRGYLQSQLSELLSPWGGITVSSLLFSASHIPNALLLPYELRQRYFSVSLPIITALGFYFGWLTYKNQSLKASVALHTWYDFTLFAMSSWAAQASVMGKSEFAVAIPF